jgi:hypothetical protein
MVGLTFTKIMKLNGFLSLFLVVGACTSHVVESNAQELEVERQEVSTFAIKDASLGFGLVIGDASEWAESEGVEDYSQAMSDAYAGDFRALKKVINITRKLEWDAAGAVSHGSGLQMILAAVGDVAMARILAESDLQEEDRLKFHALLFPTFNKAANRPMDVFPRTWRSIMK